MNTLKSLFSWLYLVFFLVGVVAGLLIGWFFFAPKVQEKEVITSRTILDKVSQKGMLITRSVLLDQKATIKVDQGSDWSNFFWGQEINARANMKVDIGVDLAKLKEDDIVINKTAKTVCFKYPNAEISSVQIEGDIEATTKNGIFKQLLDSNANRDYNNALNKLKEEATRSIGSRDDLLKEARDSSDTTLSVLLAGTEYQVETSCR